MTTKNYAELPDDQAEELLRRLGSDDAFRELFVNDPRAALAAIGHAPAQDANVNTGIWESLKVNQLADKQTINQSFQQIHRDVVSARVSANPIALDLAPTQ